MLGLIMGSAAKAYVYAWIFVIPPQSSTGMLLQYTFPNGQGQCSAYECHLPWIAECSGPGPASKISQPHSAAPIPAESSHSLLFSISLTLTFSLRALTSLTGHPLPRDSDVLRLRYDGDDGEAAGRFQGGRKVTERWLKGAAPLELWRASPPADYGTLYNARAVVTLVDPVISRSPAAGLDIACQTKRLLAINTGCVRGRGT